MSAARRPAGTAEQTPAEVEAAEKFVADLIARGEAVEKSDGEEKPLPAGSTHEIVHRDGDHAPVVKRRRYSAF